MSASKKEIDFTDNYNKVIETLNVYLNKNPGQREDQGKEAFNALNDSRLRFILNASPSVVLIYNFAKGQYEFVSKNCISLMGCQPEDLLSENGYRFAFTRFNPVQAEIFATKVTPVSMEYMSRYAQLGRVKDLKMSFTIQSKKKNDVYNWTLMQINVLETDENGIPLLSIQFLTDIQELKKDELVFFSILAKDEHEEYQFVYSETYPNTDNDFLLSSRELEIVHLSGKGINAQEIANKLFISIHTVHTHKKNILRKTSSSNMVEALRTLTIRGLI
ncbi:MAG: helix-turn-helix transcriptional regulator [Cytophagales bacterium]|nr:helix-turn-helix transcriptional regulator [Cytophaga sp.]